MRGPIAALVNAPIGGTFIKPEARRWVYWTKVSANTKVRMTSYLSTLYLFEGAMYKMDRDRAFANG